MRRISLALLSTLSLLIVAPCALAQEDNSEIIARLNRLERDLGYVQKQVYSGAGTSADGSAPAAPANAGQLQVQISKIEQEIRTLRGTVEQNQYTQRQTATDLKKLSDDVDFRLHAIEDKQAAAAAAASAPTPAATATPAAAVAAAAAAEDAKEPAHFDPAAKPEPAAKPDAKADAAKPALTGNDFPDANAHYSHAFKLLNDKKYSEASASFDAFVKKYPNDPLTSNAYYWLGESYYARTDYTRAAESFRKGFEANPAGQKAPDNLFKLSKSLEQVKRTSEACIVLDQIIKKYPDTAPRTVKRATDERVTLQCK